MTKIHLQAAVRLQREVAELEKALKKKRKWVGLTDEDWATVEDMPDAFDQGVAWAAARLQEKNT